ncbi:PEP/pyruvate-binding domain-containing protein [Desulfovibrio litoralis]|uniref:Phosphoenolpyruvate synthase n=1 Tax=Desulfovibrio litoralis DSM 11393 TaxID=1121455 RepID=A0A1M7T5X3_9BACT|nr:PEP/pyruvate-binding domain-containing protein [Desulfovibrio litoralis]SHN66095.1 pyruvate, water dikinase [Desulfovibrio litoralis DSM 11393]
MSIFNQLLSFFDYKKRKTEKERRKSAAVEALKDAFNARCKQFRVLLSANKRALEIMADMEARLSGETPFDMSYVRSQTTQVSINVYRMIEALNTLAGDAYLDLFNRFSLISGDILKVVEAKANQPLKANAPLIIPLNQAGVDLITEVGGKMANLAEVAKSLHFSVPDGFVVTASGYREFVRHNGLRDEVRRLIQSANAKELDEVFALSLNIQKLIKEAVFPRALEVQIEQAIAELEKKYPNAKFAVRSSALDEDGGETSFAGQYTSVLNVSPNDVIRKVKEVFSSKYSVQGITYRANHGLVDEDVPMCVGCIIMVNALAGGVAYSRNPMCAKADYVVINSSWGLPKTVVDGDTSPDVFSVKRPSKLDPSKSLEEQFSVLKRSIGNKEYKLICSENGLEKITLDAETAVASSLTDEQIFMLSKIVVEAEEFYGVPQDVEWAIDLNNNIIILQSRPLPKAREESEEAFNPGLPLLSEGGITASPGISTGVVRIVRLESDILEFPTGAVLVVHQAHSRWAVLLSKASAVIAETGGAAGHLASVAREYGIPAVFNANGVLAKLQNADKVYRAYQAEIKNNKDLDQLPSPPDAAYVTVDAFAAKIYQGKAENIPVVSEGERLLPVLSNSPVYKTLAEVSELIIPLNLLSPNTPEFAPAFCQTLHDITRFCHEKAVTEFFNTNSTDHLRAGKQLVAKHKLQYWIINLGDGFYEDVPTKTVDISNIASLPMLALWHGMSAVPWAGPPATTSVGFMALMAESAINPELELSRQGNNSMSARNYFLISRNYCTLQASFGYHFCTVEAQSGKNDVENYLNFHFKGGASNLAKRKARANTLGEVLSQLGFMVDIKQDALFARMEEVSEPHLFEALVAVGHIIVHSRQADIGLGSEAGVVNFRENLQTGLGQLTPFVPPEKTKITASELNGQ